MDFDGIPAPVKMALTREGARFLVLKAMCVVAEAGVQTVRDGHGSFISAVLHDCRRFSVLGGRDGLPRSLGSVYAMHVLLFCGAAFQAIATHQLETPPLPSWEHSVAISRDGLTLFLTDIDGKSHCMYVLRAADGAVLRRIGGPGDAPLQFYGPRQVCVSCDDFVFVADSGNARIQILTPKLDFYGFVGVGQLDSPWGVCSSAHVIFVSETNVSRVSVFSRGGLLLQRFGCPRLRQPKALCFMAGHRHVAVADFQKARVTLFDFEGAFRRHIGTGTLRGPVGVACADVTNDLVVTDIWSRCVFVFGASGQLHHTLGEGYFSGVAIRNGTVFAQKRKTCVVFT